MLYPSCITSKVRGIQVHNQSVGEAKAGMRTAINFQGLEKASVNRGEVLSSPSALAPSYMIDILFHFLDSNKKPVKNRTRVRFHTGTSEVLGNLTLIDREELLPGETSVVQIRLDSPVAIVKDDRFVIRSYSPVRTIGGGQVLNPIPKKHKRFKPEIIEGLKGLACNSAEETISYHVHESGYKGVSFAHLKIMTNLHEKQLHNTIEGLLSKKALILVEREKRIYIHNNSLEKLNKKTFDFLDKYHKTNPLKGGMPKEELKSKIPPIMSPKLFSLMLNQMIKEKEIIQEEDTIRLAKHKVLLEVDQADIREKILDVYLRSRLQPPYFKELGNTLNIDAKRAKDVLMLLVEEGLLIKTKEDLYFHSGAVNDLKNRLVDFLKSNGEITTAQFKEMTGASRKYVIPLIEYFDSKNVTIRVGDIRKLRAV